MLHYSFIFRNTDPLGAELNNVAHYRLGTMLYLDIQKEKDAMKKLGFQKDIVWTAICMNRIMKSDKGCDQLSSNDTIFFL